MILGYRQYVVMHMHIVQERWLILGVLLFGTYGWVLSTNPWVNIIIYYSILNNTPDLLDQFRDHEWLMVMNLWLQSLVPWVSLGPPQQKPVAFWILIPHPSTSGRLSWQVNLVNQVNQVKGFEASKVGRVAWTLPPQKPTKITNQKKAWTLV